MKPLLGYIQTYLSLQKLATYIYMIEEILKVV